MKVPIAAAALAATLAVPAAAQGATLSVGGPCFASGEAVPLTGTGYPPGAGVSIEGDASGFATADQSGTIVTTVRASSDSAQPRTMRIQAVVNGAPQATASFPVVAEPYFVDVNLNGNPRSTVRWRFAGFPTGRPIYGHYRYKGETIRNFRFGVAQAPCGTLTTRARRLPTRLRYGVWRLKFDSRRSYSADEPGRLGRLRVFRLPPRRR